jgi:hypothetical protein
MAQTGPRTTNGKMKASRNAWKHGIRSEAVVLPEAEDEREWEAFRDGIYESLDLEGTLEYLMAERVALALWKLRRLEYYQNFATIHRMDDALIDLTIAAGYGQLHRQYIQTLHELEAMQARRRGERTPLARLDITGAPGG